jgi:hypothetical protein
MYSWKRIRVICAILLLLPIVHLVYLVSRSTMEVLDVSPEIWRDEVDAYRAADNQSTLPEDPIVVVGGKRVTLWEDLPQTLSPRPVLMRGIGDAVIEDIDYHYDSLVARYRPDTVVLLPSASEFHLRDNKSPLGFLEAVQALVDKDRQLSPSRRFYLFTPIKAPVRPENHRAIENTGAVLRAWAEAQDGVIVLDANRLLSDDNGEPRPQFFRPDGNNLNEHGYLRLSVLLMSQIEMDEATLELVELDP